MNILQRIFGRNADSKKVTESINTRVIKNAYQRRKKEIDSLRQYDRGEKNIDAPNLKSTVPNVH